MCGKALLFRYIRYQNRGYAAGGEAARSRSNIPEKPSFSANRWAKPKTVFQWTLGAHQ